MQLEENYVIFRRSIRGDEPDGGLFIQLEADSQETLWAQIQPRTVYLGEMFSLASAVATVSFVDADGVYSNLVKLDHDETFWLSFGRSLEDSIRIPLKISKIEQETTSVGVAEDIFFKITLVHRSWIDMLSVRRNRGWSGVKISSIVEEIFEESGFDVMDVSPSKKSFETLIQPYWSNIQFLKWLQRKAISEKFDDHFEFGYRLDGVVFFKSVSDIIDENLPNLENGNIPVLFLASPKENPMERVKEDKGNFGIPSTFFNYSLTDFYMNSIINGGGGIEAMHWDFDSGDYVTESVTPSDMEFLQLGDWVSIKETHETSGARFYGGSDTAAANTAKAKVSGVTLSGTGMTITMPSSPKIHIGDLVEVIIPLNPDRIKQPFSIINSGFYIVSIVEHNIDLVNNEGITKVVLSRRGFDDKAVRGYVESKLGKVFESRDLTDV